jgi:hypothetical protein
MRGRARRRRRIFILQAAMLEMVVYVHDHVCVHVYGESENCGGYAEQAGHVRQKHEVSSVYPSCMWVKYDV